MAMTSVELRAAAAAAALGLAASAAAQQTPAASGRQVSGVVVTARKPKIETLTDRTVYDVKSDLQSTSGTAVAVLQNVPSVEVDADGNVTLRGDSNVTILIDGKPSAQFAGSNAGLGLQELPAGDIERIEVLTNPPARFKTEGSAGVINIITKKRQRTGLSGQVQANYGDDGRFLASGNISYVAGKWTLTGGLYLRKDFRRRIVTDARTAVNPSTGVLETSRETLNEGLRRLYGQAKAGIEYRLAPKTTIGGSISHQEVQGPRDFFQTEEASLPDGTPVSSSNRVSVGKEWDKNVGEDVHLEQRLWRPDETLTLTFKRTATNEREHYGDYDTYLLPIAPPDLKHLNLTENIATDEASAEYDLPMSHGRELRLGYDFEADWYEFHDYGDTVSPLGSPPVPNPLVTFDFRYRQQIHAGYAEYDTNWRKWTLQSGVRAEETSFTTNLDVGGLASSRSYFRAYPSVHIERALPPYTTLVVSVARRMNRPDPGALNPFVDYQDIYNLRSGNPNLLPEDVWSYEAGARWSRKAWSAGATAYYRFSRDAVTDIIEPISGDAVLDTKTNLPKSKSGGVELTASGKPLRRLTFNLSGNLFHNQIDTTGLGLPGLRSTTGFNAKASLEWKPDGADTLQATFSRSDRRLTPQGYVAALQLVNFGYRRQITPSLAIVATLTDALKGQKFRRFVATPTLDDAYQRYQVGQVAWAGVVWTFGLTPKKKTPEIEYDQP
jgi:outer membrane receptor protein involved in Fe transport